MSNSGEIHLSVIIGRPKDVLVAPNRCTNPGKQTDDDRRPRLVVRRALSEPHQRAHQPVLLLWSRVGGQEHLAESGELEPMERWLSALPVRPRGFVLDDDGQVVPRSSADLLSRANSFCP